MIGPTYPLQVASIADGLARKYAIVGAALHEFGENAWFQADVGVAPGAGRPHTTARVEKVLAAVFGGESAALVQGAGTGAIRCALAAGPWQRAQRRLLVHEAVDYSTTATTFQMGCVEPVRVNYNNDGAYRAALADRDAPTWVYVQHTRQQLDDSYDPGSVIAQARQQGKSVLVDDNYAVLRVPRIGVELGATASAFSLFKLHGPEGVGVVIGDADLVEVIRRQNYSGGGQVQGHQAMFALQQLSDAPLNWAYASQETLRLAERLRAGEVPGIIDAQAANVQDLCVVAELDRPCALQVRERCVELGAAGYPVGSNSRYEMGPLIYRLSGSVLQARPDLTETALRINPMRASADQVIDMLRKAMR